MSEPRNKMFYMTDYKTIRDAVHFGILFAFAHILCWLLALSVIGYLLLRVLGTWSMAGWLH
jgi:hypothetical protein